jgi:hypothetical protein
MFYIRLRPSTAIGCGTVAHWWQCRLTAPVSPSHPSALKRSGPRVPDGHHTINKLYPAMRWLSGQWRALPPEWEGGGCKSFAAPGPAGRATDGTADRHGQQFTA